MKNQGKNSFHWIFGVFDFIFYKLRVISLAFFCFRTCVAFPSVDTPWICKYLMYYSLQGMHKSKTRNNPKTTCNQRSSLKNITLCCRAVNPPQKTNSALKSRPIKESRLRSSRQHCLPSKARLNDPRPQKPSPPLHLALRRLAHDIHANFRPELLPHQNCLGSWNSLNRNNQVTAKQKTTHDIGQDRSESQLQSTLLYRRLIAYTRPTHLRWG